MRSLHKIIDFILPPRCILSGEIVDQQGMMSPSSWGALNFITNPKCNHCGFPFDFDLEGVNDGNLCARCIKYPPKYAKARSALIYDDASRDVILGFKHGDQTHAVPTFLPWLMRAGHDVLEKSDIIIPVPLHPTRLIKRRFNQAALMAQALSKETDLPCLVDGLIRKRATPTQGHLAMDERKKNVRKAFQIHPKHQETIKDKRVLLVDDVFTTGATVLECTKELLKNEAAEVNILTLARVVKSDRL